MKFDGKRRRNRVGVASMTFWNKVEIKRESKSERRKYRRRFFFKFPSTLSTPVCGRAGSGDGFFLFKKKIRSFLLYLFFKRFSFGSPFSMTWRRRKWFFFLGWDSAIATSARSFQIFIFVTARFFKTLSLSLSLSLSLTWRLISVTRRDRRRVDGYRFGFQNDRSGHTTTTATATTTTSTKRNPIKLGKTSSTAEVTAAIGVPWKRILNQTK